MSSTNSPKEQMKNRHFSYPPLDKHFTTENSSLQYVEMGDTPASVLNPIKYTHKAATFNYLGTDPQPIMNFKVVYMPKDNTSGRKLITVVKPLVKEVLEDNYNAETAIITQTGKDRNKRLAQKTIDECIITGAEIEIDVNDYLRITFYLQGIDNQKREGLLDK